MSLFNNTYWRVNKAGFFNLSAGLGQLVSDNVTQGLNKAFETEIGGLVSNGLDQLGVSTDLLTMIASDYAGSWAGEQVSEYDAMVQKQVRAWLRFWNFGYEGIPEKLKYREYIALSRVRKNHFIIQINSPKLGNFSKRLNLFATDIDLNPMNLSGDKQKVGGTFIDTPTGAEATEIRITTMDDKLGTIKNWFEGACSLVVSADGTFGIPADYAVTITVLHGVVDGQVMSNAFTNKGIYRPTSYEVQLSRREQAMQEVTLTFTQIDPFMG